MRKGEKVRKDVPDFTGEDKATKPWKTKTPRRGQLEVPQPLLCLSKKGSVEAENCSELTCTGQGSWGP